MPCASAPPAVSVLVPCYQDGRYLDQTLSSVAAQSFSDFEVVVSDDASTDDSAEIAQAWSQRDRRFRLLRNDQNLGMTPNWNRALSEARGGLVTKLDADDQMESRFLELMVAELIDTDVLSVFCRTLDCDEQMREIGPYKGDRALLLAGLNPTERISRRGLEWLPTCLESLQPWTSDAQMHRRSRLLTMGSWNEGWLASDLDLICRVLELDEPIVHRPELGIRYRRRPGSHRANVVKRGWGEAEGVLVPLASLERVRDHLGSAPKRVRHNWWRLWRESRQLVERGDWLGVAAEQRLTYEQALREIRRPPLTVLALGELRRLGFLLRRRLRLGRSAA